MKKPTSLRSGVLAWSRRSPSWTRRIRLKRLHSSQLRCFVSDFSIPSSGSPMSREDQCGDQVSLCVALKTEMFLTGILR